MKSYFQMAKKKYLVKIQQQFGIVGIFFNKAARFLQLRHGVLNLHVKKHGNQYTLILAPRLSDFLSDSCIPCKKIKWQLTFNKAVNKYGPFISHAIMR